MNPFSMVYNAIWDMLAEHPYFQTVAPGNRIRFDVPDDPQPIKMNIAAADLPDLLLMINSSNINLQSTSNTSEITRQYNWQFSTGDYRYTEHLAPMEFALMCACANWPKKLGTLKWNEKAFVKRVNLLSGQSGVSDPEQNRNINGWSAVFTIEVLMVFATQDLLEVLEFSHDGT